jgi:peptide/nickel transport system substrate-binding protein
MSGAVVLGLVLTACSGGGDEGPSGDAGEPQRGGTLRMQLLRDTSSGGYDPALTTQSVVYTIDGLVFDTLLEADPDGKLVPSLAESWEVSSDGLTYTFKLRQGVTFHDGSPMTSADVKFTIDRIADPATKSPRRGVFSSVAEVTAPDPATVVITLSRPYAPLLNVLADVTASIVPKAAVEAKGAEFTNAPVGTGAFKWESWRRDTEIKLVANKDYWQPDLPYLDGVTVSFNADSNARAANVRSGTVDLLWNAPPELYTVLKEDSSVQAVGGDGSTSFQYMLMNMQKAPFDDVRVRQAIFNALDREQIRTISRPDTTATLNGGFLPPGHWAALQSPVYGTGEVAKAKSLLAEAGKSAGFPMEIMVLIGSDFHIRSAQAVQQQLQPLGIQVQVSTVDSGQQQQRLAEGNFDAVITGFSGSLDPDERLTAAFGTDGGVNYAKFSDPQVDDLIAQGRAATDQAQRATIYQQVQQRIAEVGPMAFTFNYNYFDVLGENVHGYVYNPTTVNYRSIRQVWIEQ